MGERIIQPVGNRCCKCNLDCNHKYSQEEFSPKGIGVFPWNQLTECNDGVYIPAFVCTHPDAPFQKNGYFRRACILYTAGPIKEMTVQKK
jgi:hypothetical protein